MRTIAIVGATGAVGQEFCRVLAQRGRSGRRFVYFASPRSAGAIIDGVDGRVTCSALTDRSFVGVDIAFFSAGGSISREFAPLAVDAGAVVVDNSSAFRLEPDVPLVVPEVNASAIVGHRGIIANPNCSTIILAIALWPLHQAARVRRAVVSTYQAASGAGARALQELVDQTGDVLAGRPARPAVFPTPCAFNVFSHNSPIGPDGANGEERKMADETKKIFGCDSIKIIATCLRAPVMRAHTETIAVELAQPLDPDAARALLAAAPGVRVVDDRVGGVFPTPLDATGVDDVLVGRIRSDPTVDVGHGLLLMCSGDQLRKGAALNAVQIAERLPEWR